MEKIVERAVNGYGLCVVGDLNGWVGDRVRVGMIGTFGVLKGR